MQQGPPSAGTHRYVILVIVLVGVLMSVLDGIVVSSKMETNIAGVFAAGDVVSYPGKLKLIATGFGEAAMAANYAKTFIDPESEAFPGHSSTIVPKQRKAAQGGGEREK